MYNNAFFYVRTATVQLAETQPFIKKNRRFSKFGESELLHHERRVTVNNGVSTVLACKERS